MLIKSVRTEYGDNFYRSKLEANWARYFDRNCIEHEHKYESTQFDLGRHKYTPDFCFPGFGLWVEIKPFRQYKPHSKCFHLAIESCQTVRLVQGSPERHVVDLFDPRAHRRYAHHTVVREAAIKPSKEFFQFPKNPVDEEGLILTGRSIDEIIRFPFLDSIQSEIQRLSS